MKRIRRRRGVYNESPSDLVEYHVVREGVDEEAIFDLLRPRFVAARVFAYWSTQSPMLQALGQRSRLKTNFGVIATGCLAENREGSHRGPLPGSA